MAYNKSMSGEPDPEVSESPTTIPITTVNLDIPVDNVDMDDIEKKKKENLTFWDEQKKKNEEPAPSKETEEIINLMKEEMRLERERMEQERPAIAHQLRYKIDEDGTWVPMTDEEWYNHEWTTDTQRQEMDRFQEQQLFDDRQMEIAGKQMDRYEQALEGKLPLTQQMIDQKAEEFQELKNMGNIVGATSTSAAGEDTLGIQQLNAFNKRWGQLEEQQRYGELAGGGRTVLTGDPAGPPSSTFGELTGLSTMGGAQSMQRMQGYSSILQPYMAYDQMAMQKKIADAQNRSAEKASLYGLGGLATGIMLSKL